VYNFSYVLGIYASMAPPLRNGRWQRNRFVLHMGFGLQNWCHAWRSIVHPFNTEKQESESRSLLVISIGPTGRDETINK
jgi:hypothetical protein